MSSTALVSNVKLITSGNIPTTTNLFPGELAFGMIEGKAELYGNVGGMGAGHVEGLNLNDCLGRSFLPQLVIENVPLDELQSTIDSLSKFLNRVVRIIVEPGTLDQRISVLHFTGPGQLWIESPTPMTISYEFSVIGFDVSGCNNDRIEIRGFNITENQGRGVQLSNNTALIVLHALNIEEGVNTTANNVGIWVSVCRFAHIVNSRISNKLVAMQARFSNVITSSVSGELNSTVIWGAENSIIQEHIVNTIDGETPLILISGAKFYNVLHSTGWHVQNGLFPAGRTINNVPITELQNLINSLPRYLSSNIVINVLPGTLPIGSVHGVIVARFSGPGTLTINGNVGTLSATHQISHLLIERCTNESIIVNGFDFIGEGGQVVHVRYNTSRIIFRWNLCIAGNSSDPALQGIHIAGTPYAYVENCQISNKGLAIDVRDNSNVNVVNISGVGNNMLYRSRQGSQLSRENAGTMTGAGAVNTVFGGGSIILPSGHIIGS